MNFAFSERKFRLRSAFTECDVDCISKKRRSHVVSLCLKFTQSVANRTKLSLRENKRVMIEKDMRISARSSLTVTLLLVLLIYSYQVVNFTSRLQRDNTAVIVAVIRGGEEKLWKMHSEAQTPIVNCSEEESSRNTSVGEWRRNFKLVFRPLPEIKSAFQLRVACLLEERSMHLLADDINAYICRETHKSEACKALHASAKRLYFTEQKRLFASAR